MRRLYLLIGGFCLACLCWGLVEPYLLEVSRVELFSNDVPEAFDGKRLVFLSDVHCGVLFSPRAVGELVDKVNGLHPDIVLIGGDNVSGGTQWTGPCDGRFSGFQAPLGVYGVLGNHDHEAGELESLRALEAAGVTVLDNKGVWVGDGGGRIRLGGVGDLWKGTQDMRPVMDGVKPEDFMILLSHNPDYAERLREGEVDLMLAGHTHGGQVNFFGLFAPFQAIEHRDKYLSGIVNLGKTLVYVTRGVGEGGIPVRFFSRPELVEITLRHG